MPPRIDTAVQGVAMQHVQDVQAAQPQVPAPALGRSQSTGTTIARVFTAIASTVLSGITSLFNLVRSVFTGHAQPRLPANQLTQEQQAQAIRMLNRDLGAQILDGRTYLQSLYETRNQEFPKLASTLGLTAHDAIDDGPFKERVLQVVYDSPKLLTAKELPAVATRITREMMFNAFFEKTFDAVPNKAFLEPSHFNTMRARHVHSEDMRALVNAGPGVDVAALAEKVCTDIKSQINSLGNCEKASKEAVAEGLQLFQSLTGLSTETVATLNTERVSNKFTETFRAHYENPAVNARTPQDFRMANQQMANDFFTSRAKTYNSIATLRDTKGLPSELAATWQRLCLETDLKLPTNTFSMAQEISQGIRKAVNMEKLACTPMQDSEFINGIKTMFNVQYNARMTDFKEGQLQLDPPTREMVTTLIAQHVLATSPRQVSVELDPYADRIVRVSDQLRTDLDDCLNELHAADESSAEALQASKERLEEIQGPTEFFGALIAAAYDNNHPQ